MSLLPASLTPAVATAKRRCIASLSSTMPSPARSTAEASRNTSPSSPIAKPTMATKSPMLVNDRTRPATKAGMPKR